MNEIVAAASNFRAFERGALKGFFDLALPNVGIIIRGLSWYEKNGREWVNLPSKAMTDKDGKPIMDQQTGKQRYQNIVDVSNGLREEFQASALAAIHRLTDQDRRAPEMSEEVPF